MTALIAQAAAQADILEEGLQFTHLLLLFFGAAIGIYVVLLFGGRFLKRRFNLPLGWAYHLFCIAAALYFPTLLPGIQIGTDDTEAKTFVPLVAITGTLVAIGFIRHYCYERFQSGQNTQVPKFLSQFLSVTLAVAAILILLDTVYHVPVTGLLAGAGIAGIVLGLALQDTLGNIFSGFAIYFGKQFKAGDWLLVDDKHAQIVEINWRSTQLRTVDDVYLDIPNSNITKQTVVNYSYPTSRHAVRLDIGLEYGAAPTRIREVLVEAALDCPHVLRDPAPDVFLKEFGDWSVTYQLRFWLADHLFYEEANSQIRTSLWYALRRNQIEIPFPLQHEMSVEPPPPHVEDRQKIRASLRNTSFAPCLSEAQLDQLTAAARIVEFGRGENIIRQDAPAGPMYVLVSGHAEVWLESKGVRTSVAVLGPDACIGETSVLTGEKRTATILALEDCTAVEVNKATLAPLINSSPELLQSLSELLARRRLQNEGVVAGASEASSGERHQDYQKGFLQKLRTFFEV